MPRIVLDCDTKNEIDDQFAIVYALGKAMLEADVLIEGIVNVQNAGASGPDSVRLYQRETECILRSMCQTDVPNLRGVPQPMVDQRTPADAEGVDFIIARARARSEGPLTVIATGPASDLAAAILKAPDIADNIRGVWLGAFLGPDDAARTGGGECNFSNDRWAAKALFESHMPLIHIPALGVTEKLVWDTGWVVDKLRAAGTPPTRFLADLLQTSPHMNANKQFWDIGAVACVLNPEWTTMSRRPAHGVTDDGVWEFTPEGSRDIEFVEDLDVEAILADAMKVYTGLT